MLKKYKIHYYFYNVYPRCFTALQSYICIYSKFKSNWIRYVKSKQMNLKICLLRWSSPVRMSHNVTNGRHWVRKNPKNTYIYIVFGQWNSLKTHAVLSATYHSPMSEIVITRRKLGTISGSEIIKVCCDLSRKLIFKYAHDRLLYVRIMYN